MRAESLIAIKSSPANGIDVAACLPWAIRPALPGPRTRGESKSFDPAGRGASQHIVKTRAASAVIQPLWNYAICVASLPLCSQRAFGRRIALLKPFRGPLAAIRNFRARDPAVGLRRILDNPEAMAAVERSLGANIIETIINKSDTVVSFRQSCVIVVRRLLFVFAGRFDPEDKLVPFVMFV